MTLEEARLIVVEGINYAAYMVCRRVGGDSSHRNSLAVDPHRFW